MTLKPTHKYDDIIKLEHHVSPKRAGMTMEDRAAQFAPFSALTGYDDVIRETGRLTDGAVELTQSSIQWLNSKLVYLSDHAKQTPRITVTWFRPDGRKSGGSYVIQTGLFKRVDECQQFLILTDGQQIPLEAIYGIDWDEE